MTQFTNVTSYLWVQNALSPCSLRECIKFVIILAKSPCQVCSEFPDVHNYIWLYICTGFVGLITAQVYLLPVHWVLFIAYKRCKVFKSCWTFWHCDLSAIYRTVYFIKPAHHKGLALVPVFNTGSRGSTLSAILWLTFKMMVIFQWRINKGQLRWLVVKTYQIRLI